MAITMNLQSKKTLAKHLQKTINQHFNATNETRMTLGSVGQAIAEGLDYETHEKLVQALKAHTTPSDQVDDPSSEDINHMVQDILATVLGILCDYLGDGDVDGEDADRIIELFFREIQFTFFFAFEFLPNAGFETGATELPAGLDWHRARTSHFFFKLVDRYWLTLQSDGWNIEEFPETGGVAAAFRYYNDPSLLSEHDELKELFFDMHDVCDQLPACLEEELSFVNQVLKLKLVGPSDDSEDDALLAEALSRHSKTSGSDFSPILHDGNLLPIARILPGAFLRALVNHFRLEPERITGLVMAAERDAQEALTRFFTCPACEAGECGDHNAA